MDQRISALSDSGLDLYAAAREAGQYEVAYHALCCVLHTAETLQHRETLELVRQHANECRAWIDANAPGHKLSTRSAQSRGHEGIFRQLAVMAEAACLRIYAEVLIKQGRPQAPLADTKV